jgi:hypothetical protein
MSAREKAIEALRELARHHYGDCDCVADTIECALKQQRALETVLTRRCDVTSEGAFVISYDLLPGVSTTEEQIRAEERAKCEAVIVAFLREGASHFRARKFEDEAKALDAFATAIAAGKHRVPQ